LPTFRYIIAILGVLTLAPGCSDDPGSLTGAGSTEPDEPSGDPGGAPTTPPAQTKPEPTPAPPPTFGEKTLARARQWITAQMPYCGGPNGGHDLICGGTCERTGTAENPEWDAYRSDCSGFVSWSWALKPPGRTTSTLAPYDTEESVLIQVDDLAPGDALNSGHHVMLFGGWTDKQSGKATVLQESRCDTLASEKIATFTVVDETTLKISDGRLFHPIRYRGAR
jgi:hypothetical protein